MSSWTAGADLAVESERWPWEQCRRWDCGDPDLGKASRSFRWYRPHEAAHPWPARRCPALCSQPRWPLGGLPAIMGTRRRLGLKIWDAANGKLVKNLPISEPFCGVGFSPDGKLLLTTAGRYRLWEVGTWEEKLDLGNTEGTGRFRLFSRQQNTGTSGEPGVIRLVDPMTGSEYVRLDSPEQTRLSQVVSLPDWWQRIPLGSSAQGCTFGIRVSSGRQRRPRIGLGTHRNIGPNRLLNRPCESRLSRSSRHAANTKAKTLQVSQEFASLCN